MTCKALKEVRMRSRVITLLAVLLAATLSTRAYAQGSFFTSLSGIVVDAQGGVIPGADVKIQNTGTGETVNVVTAIDGAFTASSLPGGIYSVTVTLSGFKTAVLNAVTLNASVPATVKVTLLVGTVTEN